GWVLRSKHRWHCHPVTAANRRSRTITGRPTAISYQHICSVSTQPPRITAEGVGTQAVHRALAVVTPHQRASRVDSPVEGSPEAHPGSERHRHLRTATADGRSLHFSRRQLTTATTTEIRKQEIIMGLFSMFSRKKHQKTAPDQIGADQSSVFSRISNLLRANIHAALDEAEDPEKMLDQFVRDFTANIKDAEEAVAETIGNLRLMERDRLEAAKEVETWQTRAIAASNRAEEQKAKGQSHQAEKSDRLATDAIMKFQSTKR